MSSNSIPLTTQLLTISVLSLQRQLYHNRALNLNTSTHWWNSSYDFVIVGGGSAGCVLASRLTENSSVSVLLLEAGGPVTISSDSTATYFAFNYMWNYRSVPQRYSSLGSNGRTFPIPRGRLLGGTSSVNYANYVRGNRRAFDSWSEIYGADGWNWQAVLPYFLRAENNTNPAIVAANPSYHSTSGPLQVSTVMHPDAIMTHWNEAAVQLGWPMVDLNGPDQYGTSMLQTTQSPLNWTRQSSYVAYIEPHIASRPNLHVLVNSLATRILFTNTTKRANGIEFTRNNVTYQVFARREVIISGGTINSPQLLMLSGIGPRSQLAQFGIPLVADLPVGKQYIDHVTVFVDFLLRNASDIGWPNGTRGTELNADHMYQFLANHDGPLTRMPGIYTFIGTGINGDRDFPDGVAFLLSNQNPLNVEQTVDGYDRSLQDQWRTYIQPLSETNRRFGVHFGLFHPMSRGSVRLASTNPQEYPLIDPNFLSNPQDVAALVRLMGIGLSIAESDYMRGYMNIYDRPVPGCEPCRDGRPVSRCTPYLTCIVRMYTNPTLHMVGTCRMGNATNADAVVDERLRVRGVDALRVVDGSVLPNVVNAPNNAAIIMIAERMADLIKQDNDL